MPSMGILQSITPGVKMAGVTRWVVDKTHSDKTPSYKKNSMTKPYLGQNPTKDTLVFIF